ncbi:MAG: hypothetical protein HQL63_15680 [Magnetococcales bacterium]|nr:hypothetical protein [Magnetococcales bacterium]
MENTIRATLSPPESIQVFGSGNVKIVAGDQVSIIKTTLLPLPGLTGTVKAGSLGLALVGPALGLVGVVLAISWMSHVVIKHASRVPQPKTVVEIQSAAAPAVS